MHHLRDIDPDILLAHTYFDISLSMSTPTFPNDRPIEFITIVLRAAVQGLLKCCSLSWMELSKGGAYDVRFYGFFGAEMGGNSSFPARQKIGKATNVKYP